ncbi:hypothetical protein G7Z17_g9915 [Cylindrodendrum hubeiense]|uniref:Uncharacterized protein n=1 Tax=Cylindrodendrum hubeiense TaxID=595255 RepID=A0A9P5LD73_9HYPO|nr:hypothetical protein G7Z17_g9915 [Cylindrodendrum hubeiense]
MPSEAARLLPLLALLLSLFLFSPCALAQLDPSTVLAARDDDTPLSGGPLRDQKYLPAQIGGIIGAYAVSLVLVAIALLALSKKRREHLSAGNDEIDFSVHKDIALPETLKIITDGPTIQNFSLPSPTNGEFGAPSPYVYPSPTSTVGAPGVNQFVDQRIVAADRVMAQSQLEDMYKHVLEHEDAKRRGESYEAPLPVPAYQPRSSTSVGSMKSATTTFSKKERSKPAGLNLSSAREEKTQSRTSSLLSALRSPKKKAMRGVSISSPIMTPQSATFPRHEEQELSAIPPRHYAPAAPPPVPTNQVPFGAVYSRPPAPSTADISPQSVMSIDERIEFQLPPGSQTHTRNISQAPTEVDPESATSEHSQAHLVGLPTSPKPGARFPTLPSSPKPGQTFQRSSNTPSAVRTGGSLPLRAYEPSVSSHTVVGQTTKQTVFERKGPLSPGGGMTPFTASAVPYSPYQPFTPCMPMTPSLVTREDRKRMKRMVPKTPTLNMVQSSEDVW